MHLVGLVQTALTRSAVLLHGEGAEFYDYQRDAVLRAFKGEDMIVSVRTGGGSVWEDPKYPRYGVVG